MELTDLAGRSPAIRIALSQAERVAPRTSPVLILGERGTGKTTLGRYLHRWSGRSGLFLSYSAGATSSELALADLFGHTRGAFTGASMERIGLVESARGGTLLIDELGTASPSLQLALLTLFDRDAVRRVGEDRPRPVTARLLFATNTDLDQAVAQGAFRPDLLDRIGYLVIRMPPLRDRREDIPDLFQDFYARALRRFEPDEAPQPLGTTLADLLAGYHWPGNVRQLEHVAEATAVFAEPGRPLQVADLPPEFLRELGLASEPSASPVAELARSALRRAGGNESKAARDLNMPRTSFRRLLERSGKLAEWSDRSASS